MDLFLAIAAKESSLIKKNISDKPLCIVLFVIGRIDLLPGETTTILLIDLWASFLAEPLGARPQGACLQACGPDFFSLSSKRFRVVSEQSKMTEERRGTRILVSAGRKMERERGLFLSFIFRAAKTENPFPCSLLWNRKETFATQTTTSSFHFVLTLDLWIPLENCVTSQAVWDGPPGELVRWPAGRRSFPVLLACFALAFSRLKSEK